MNVEIYDTEGKVLVRNTYDNKKSIATYTLFDENGKIKRESKREDLAWSRFHVNHNLMSMYESFMLDEKNRKDFLEFALDIDNL
ncbi:MULTISPECIES: hypothetical protein [Fusobacterium]|uniref:hypothetical protein n=1 Tax=Fusobacterium TaxID=848 RepID=UPI001477698A|nr:MULTISPECIES: hypothetical protein [Fusobacterium]NME36481.1 hypothetical protein [Fusobacterium sp. FSA-380-WT-3A]